MLDWIIGFCHKTAEIHFLGISCSTFSLFTFHLENSTLSAHAKPSLENNLSNLLISIGVVIKITLYGLFHGDFLICSKCYPDGDVIRKYGNMSQLTKFYVLKKNISQRQHALWTNEVKEGNFVF